MICVWDIVELFEEISHFKTLSLDGIYFAPMYYQMLLWPKKNSECIQLHTSYWGGEVSETIPQFQRRIEYLKSLLPELTGVKFLKHTKRVKDKIEMWKAQIAHEDFDTICIKLH